MFCVCTVLLNIIFFSEGCSSEGNWNSYLLSQHIYDILLMRMRVDYSPLLLSRKNQFDVSFSHRSEI